MLMIADDGVAVSTQFHVEDCGLFGWCDGLAHSILASSLDGQLQKPIRALRATT
jgi:hypothetical protein